MTDWAKEPKTSLTPQEVIKVAFQHLILGIDQATLASMYGVNQGRINEAVVVMRETAEKHMEFHRARSKEHKA